MGQTAAVYKRGLAHCSLQAGMSLAAAHEAQACELAPTALYLGDFIAYDNEKEDSARVVHALRDIPHNAHHISQTKIGNLRQRLMIGRPLAEGSFGQASVCIDKKTNQQYVIKQSKYGLTQKTVDDMTTEAFFAQLLVEGPAAAHFFPAGKPCTNLSAASAQIITSQIHSMQQHPGYFHIHRLVHFDPTWPCILSEPCDGTLSDLRGRISNEFRRSGPPQLWKTFAQQILNGISYMHSMGIAHQDIKLPNIFYRGNQCYIADFGLASREAHSRDGSGTVATMAPEVRPMNIYDPKIADMYSVACTLLDLIGFPLGGGVNNWHMAAQVNQRYRGIPELQCAARVVLAPDPLHRREIYNRDLMRILRGSTVYNILSPASPARHQQPSPAPRLLSQYTQKRQQRQKPMHQPKRHAHQPEMMAL